MAAGPDPTTVDEADSQEHPGEGEPVGGHVGEDVVAHDEAVVGHDDHGHDDHDDHGHGHDDHDDHGAHGPVNDKWVLLPLVIGLVIGLALALFFGLDSGASPLG